MAFGYRERRGDQTVSIKGELLAPDRPDKASYKAKLEGVVTVCWLPKKCCEWDESGTFLVPQWLAKKEGWID